VRVPSGICNNSSNNENCSSDASQDRRDQNLSADFSRISDIRRVSVVTPGNSILFCRSQLITRSNSRPGFSLLSQLRVNSNRLNLKVHDHEKA